MKINPQQQSEYGILLDASTPLFDNGFVRDSADGLVYEPQPPKNLTEQKFNLVFGTGGFNNENTSKRPKPLNQPKSGIDDYVATVNAYLALKEMLQGVVEIEINDINDSIDLLNSEFHSYYAKIITESGE